MNTQNYTLSGRTDKKAVKNELLFIKYRYFNATLTIFKEEQSTMENYKFSLL